MAGKLLYAIPEQSMSQSQKIQWYVPKVQVVLPNQQEPKIPLQNVANLLLYQTIQKPIMNRFSFGRALQLYHESLQSQEVNLSTRKPRKPINTLKSQIRPKVTVS